MDEFVTGIYNAIREFILKILDLCNVDTNNVPEWLLTPAE